MSTAFNYVSSDIAVACVQHDYTSCPSSTKMDGLAQEWYPRKNWSSLMVFNCGHPSAAKLTAATVETGQPSWLHRIRWADDAQIGAVPHRFNYLVGYYEDVERPVAYHFTDGGPWHLQSRDVQFGDRWLRYLTAEEKTSLAQHLRELKRESGNSTGTAV